MAALSIPDNTGFNHYLSENVKRAVWSPKILSVDGSQPCGMPGAQRGAVPIYRSRVPLSPPCASLSGFRCGAPPRDSEVASHRSEDYIDRHEA